MKKVTNVFVNREERKIAKTFHLNERIFKDLYYTITPKKVLTNLKTFKIAVTPSKGDKSMGVKYSKHDQFVILTFNLIEDDKYVTGQFMLKDGVDLDEIVKCKHPIVEAIKPQIIKCFGLLGEVTAEDLINLKLDE